jgi:hypothetical protein
MNYRSDQDSSRLLAIEDYVSLKPEAPIPRPERARVLSNARKIREKAKTALQTREVSFGLIRTETICAVDIDCEEFGLGAFRETGLIPSREDDDLYAGSPSWPGLSRPSTRFCHPPLSED